MAYLYRTVINSLSDSRINLTRDAKSPWISSYLRGHAASSYNWHTRHNGGRAVYAPSCGGTRDFGGVSTREHLV